MLNLTLPELLEVFARLPEVSLLDNPTLATRRCHEISRALQAWLSANHRASNLIELKIEATHLTTAAVARWEIEDSSAVVHHWVVQIGDLYIDYTAKQFDPSLPIPHIATRAQFEAAHWQVVAPSNTEGSP